MLIYVIHVYHYRASFCSRSRQGSRLPGGAASETSLLSFVARRLHRVRAIVRPREGLNRAELFRGDLKGTKARGVIVDLAGGDNLVGASLVE